MAAITITGSNKITGDLIMVDHNGNSASTFIASRGEVITWIILPQSGVSHITQIDKKDIPNNSNIFNPLPHQLGGANNWTGTIDNSLSPSGHQEIYFIKWDDEASPAVNHLYDPIIQINPK